MIKVQDSAEKAASAKISFTTKKPINWREKKQQQSLLQHQFDVLDTNSVAKAAKKSC